MPDFCHLHCHTAYSLLDGAARIKTLIKRAAALEMKALGITDHGNLFGVPEFYMTAKKAGIQPVLGCEFYVTASGMQDRSDRVRYHQVLWAKNNQGYRNLIRLSSLSYTDGYYYKPRIDHEALRRYGEGLVATTCCLQGEVPQTILKKGEETARTLFEAYLDIFGDDYYIEIQNHGIPEQQTVNAVMLRWAREYGVKVVATNDVHYVEEADAEAQDVLLCLQTGKDLLDPSRMRFENNQFYLKDVGEMQSAIAAVDPDIVAESLVTSCEIADKCRFDLEMGKLLMPHYPIPEAFDNDIDGFLRHLVFERARLRYPEMPQDVVDRLNHELGIIKKMGYAGYFLIVQDFTTAARDLGVSVGPGRGSAAGSAVAYCLGITNIDPLSYDLLFERFLNPERVSMPDIDIDFDDRGRGAVIDYVIQKYGRENVCQIITFGTMGARSAIRDVARVLGIPLPEADRIAKLIPEGPKVNLASAMADVKEFRALKDDPNAQIRKLIHYAEVLEGSARHTGVHAAGVIIAPGTVSDYVPVAIAKSKGDQVLTTQYDGNWIEKFGLLKMDFLGLSTLTVLKDAVALIKENHGVDIDLDALPLDDTKTFELFQRGETVAIFQFESEGMREWMTKLKPSRLEDLIAMNALYRPGPMDLIPNYIKRKHGQEEIDYPHPMLEPVLEKTFGIPVYQEQVMQMAQVMGGFSLGKADVLRRIMGKKKVKEMDEQRVLFVEGAKERDVDEKTANEVFDMMAKFAGYGFNRCVRAETELIDALTGERTTIGSLFRDRRPFWIHSLGKDGKLRPKPVTDVMWNGRKPVFELRTALGKRIVATGNHPFLTFGGWTNLEKLQLGDRIAVPRKIQLDTKSRWPRHKLITLAGLIAEGNTGHPTCPYFYSNDHAQIDDFAQNIEHFPHSVARIDERWDGRFEVCANTGRDTRFKPGQIPWNVRHHVQNTKRGLTSKAIAQSDVFWDRVVSITPQGVADTYDLTVEDDHNFVADGIIVHNSHAAAYSLVAYQTAYLKAHFPAEFMAAAMTNAMGDTKKLAVVLEEARKLHMELLPPSINHSQAHFTVEDGKIRFGLGAIKGVGLGAIEVIAKAREKNGPAHTLFGLTKALDIRTVGKKALDCLARVGALDDLEGHRAQLVEAVDAAAQYAQKAQADEAAGQNSLFGGDGTSGVSLEPNLPIVDPWPTARLLKEERELIGFYVSGHPLDAYRPEAAAFATAQLGDTDAFMHAEEEGPSQPGRNGHTGRNGRNGYESNKPQHSFCGIITDVQRRTTRTGKPIAFATLEDFTGQGELVCFSTILEKIQNYLKVDEIVLARGEVEVRGGSVKILTRDVIPMWKVREQLVKSIVVRIQPDRVDLKVIEQFRALCDDNRGHCRLYFDLLDPTLPEGRQRIRSRTYVVDPTPELMTGIKRLFGQENVLLEGAD